MPGKSHTFYAVAFEENFSLRALAPSYAGAKVTPREIHVKSAGDGDMFIYPFGAVVFHDVPPQYRAEELSRLDAARGKLTTRVVREDFTVREAPEAEIGMQSDVLLLDLLTVARTETVALTLAQSAAMEYYEQIVESLFVRTGALIERLEKIGSVSMRTRPLHRFIGESISIRSEVLSVLYLLDKPDETWNDPAMDRIYDDLRSEFDLVDRWQSLEAKLRSVQEALELVLDVARDRRMLTLEVAITVLFVFEVALELFRRI